MTEGRPLRVVVLTQEDRFFIPRNVDLICREPGMDVREIAVLDARGSLDNMRGRLLRWFGPAALARLALRAGTLAAADVVQRATGGRVGGRPASLRAVARRHGIPFRIERDANAPAFLERLRGHAPDVVVSFSAPQVFRRELLGLPAKGCINLHCSLLPHYRGLLPSFWVLFHGEPRSGATVHLMDAEIDNGGILAQAEVDIRGFRTMTQVLDATKRRGGELMVETLRRLRAGGVEALPNPVDDGSYFTWPTDDQARAFRAKGLSLA
ncbi:methionyl-tRNA formyltransferase [Longimicrobium sp.]|uniref:methionyl-tRNA formyltransferase n=1 Tax=Longimicrobium sp. TaxID=2029185 RepID=UPI002E304157|nr:formyltransferase family protein [Longimicrobium sp.]HEX6041336.1 formyltransferase family protein [Longimicrobium sp.]